jgi:glycosidase
LLAFRKKYPALGTLGKIDFIYAKENTYPLAYTRSLNGKKFLIVLNPSGKQTLVNLGRDYQTKRLKPLIVKNLKFSAKTTDLMIESDALSYGIFEVL